MNFTTFIVSFCIAIGLYLLGLGGFTLFKYLKNKKAFKKAKQIEEVKDNEQSKE